MSRMLAAIATMTASTRITGLSFSFRGDLLWEVDGAYFPTRANTTQISAECQIHQVIENCARYCELIDEDWLKVADWYQLDDELKMGVTAEKLYADWRSTR
jgi:hypothetical protein